VLAIKNGVPVVAVDPVAGGAKIRRQAESIGWPVILDGETASDGALLAAYEYCLTGAAREQARHCGARARTALADVEEQFLNFMQQPANTRQALPA
jgi:hypothetical protein